MIAPDPSGLDRPAGKFTVMLTTEGTYPFHGGGVSTWCDVLLQGMPEVDFKIVAVMMNPFLRQRYDLPENVVDMIKAPIWGVEEPLEYTMGTAFSRAYETKRLTTDAVVEAHFIPIFTAFLHELLRDGNPTLVGMLLYGMYQYFLRYDYNVTFRCRHVWEAFRSELILSVEEARTEARNRPAIVRPTGNLPPEPDEDAFLTEMPSILEATDCLRWLYRFLIILSHPVPLADVTHAAAAAFCGIPCIIAKQAYGAPFLLTEHGVYLREQYLSVGRSDYTFHSKRFLLKLISTIVHCCYRYADVVAPVCRWNTRWELRHGVEPSRIRVIHNGVDPDRFRPMSVERDPRPTVVTMALIFPLKDIATLIHAADLTRRRIPTVQFKLFGPASDELYYQSCLRLRDRLHLGETFHFMGRTSSPEVAYNQADVVALSSLSEAFPFSVVEAMMCGKANVATDVGGVSEALGDAGYIVRARDPERLAEKIVDLLNNSEARNQMGQDARDRALSYFTVEKCIAEYRDAYESLIRNPMARVYAPAA